MKMYAFSIFSRRFCKAKISIRSIESSVKIYENVCIFIYFLGAEIPVLTSLIIPPGVEVHGISKRQLSIGDSQCSHYKKFRT